MKAFHIFTNGTQIGPISESDVRLMIADGRVQSRDVCWTEGMTEWQPITDAIDLTSKIPPAPPPAPQRPVVYHHHAQSVSGHFVNWVPTLILYSIDSTLGIMASLMEYDNKDLADSISFFSLPINILTIVFCCLLHHKCWSSLPEPFRVTTPGKAVGFLFIPFYNFYWAFISWPKLVEGLERWEVSLGRNPVVNRDWSQGLAQIYALLYVIAIMGGFMIGFSGKSSPTWDISIYLLDLIVFIILYKAVTERINNNHNISNN